MPDLQLHMVSKTFHAPGTPPVAAVSNLSLTVAEKEFLVLVGPSGCGKTTTLRLIAGLETLEQGTIAVGGAPIHHLPPHQRDVGMVFQSASLFSHLSVFENIAFGLRLRKVGATEVAEKVRSAAAILGLDHCLSRKPDTLSGGERQRVSLGRLLVRQPRILLLDEPLAHLEMALRDELRAEIMRMHASLGATTVYVTHDPDEALALGDRVAALRAGELQQIGPGQELYRHPVNRFVAQFIGTPPMLLFPGRLLHQDNGVCFAWSNGEQIPLPRDKTSLRYFAGRKVTLGLRHESLRLSSDGQFMLEARVASVRATGPEIRCELATAHGSFVWRTRSDPRLQKDGLVKLEWDWKGVHFFDEENGSTLR